MRTSARASAAVLPATPRSRSSTSALRLVSHPGRAILGSGRDPQIFVWSFAWWPHAIGTWQNPFVTHAIYAPGRDQPRLGDDVPGARARLRAR